MVLPEGGDISFELGGSNLALNNKFKRKVN